jgi:Mn2+/Fe2+ NRAMP family transporter
VAGKIRRWDVFVLVVVLVLVVAFVAVFWHAHKLTSQIR